GKDNVATERGEVDVADVVIANLPPANVAELVERPLPAPLRGLQGPPEDGWGAFTLHLGVHEESVAETSVLHHQIIAGRPLSEGGSLFLSVSPLWDSSRAPAGRRAVTISTHTRLQPWWHVFHSDRDGYEERKREYQQRLMRAAGRVFPQIETSAELVLPGSPVTFRRYTGRSNGWVGGFPQTSLMRAWPPRLAPNLYLVGDSIFPGQSTAAVALGGLRVGDRIAAEH
ncbi:MAG: hypothetical protein R3300_19260, partial [Candidatus Promineifilaceae bacterium]|nr:hypothetical protein [Candidatus Promineifilaceae bacterium]